MAAKLSPFFPIIYVRGYAMTPGEIADTVSTPYMGFNLGSTRVRQSWDGQVLRHIFESPLIRLMKEYGYRDIYSDGAEIEGPLPPRSIIIYRYYEAADKDFGSGKALSVVQAAQGLRTLIHRLRQQVCGEDAELLAQFKVHLVAHSMGGLVCRCFLQNDDISTGEDRELVDKVFTYATPHNGIELAGANVPFMLQLWDVHNFNRDWMAQYLGLPAGESRVDSLGGKFDPQRFFCLVGTNHRDYEVALGLSRRLAGAMSDGLVRIENATVRGAPRAFVYRSHSGAYGVVNSEEGYQNLVRFLFGDTRIDGVLEVENLPLPPSVRKAMEAGKSIRASYYFEVAVAPRGAMNFKLSERRRETYSAVLRKYDELLRVDRTELESPRWPVLFSAYLDSARITSGRSLVFSVELAVSTTGYTIDGVLFLDKHIPGEYLFQDTVTVIARRERGTWSVRYILAAERWGEGRGRKAAASAEGFRISLQTSKGFKAILRLQGGANARELGQNPSLASSQSA